jgi:hypothetical protein
VVGIIRKKQGGGSARSCDMEKAEARAATVVKIPVSFPIPVDWASKFVKWRLTDTPSSRANRVLPCSGQAVTFAVISTKPSGIVLVNDGVETWRS